MLPYMQSCMSRAAFSTVSGIDSLHTMLCSARDSYLVLPSFVGRMARPNGWDHNAYVDNLYSALQYRCFPSACHNASEKIVTRWLAKPNLHLQALFRALLCKHMYSDWSSLVHRRLSVLYSEYDGNIVAALANLEPRLLCLPMTSRVAVI